MNDMSLFDNKIRNRVDHLIKSYLEEQNIESDKYINSYNKRDSDFTNFGNTNYVKKMFIKEEEELETDKINSFYESYKSSSFSKEESLEEIFQKLSLYNIFSLARHNKHDVLECLLIKGISPDSKDVDGNTILIISAQNGNKRIIKIALRYGAQINMKNCNGNTALHFAVEYNYIDVANYLIKKGANTNIENILGIKAKEGLRRKSVKFLESQNSSTLGYNTTRSKTNTSKMFRFDKKNININFIENFKNDKNTFNNCIKKLEIKFQNKPKII